MSAILATAFGLPYDTVLLITTVAATLGIGIAMLAIVFLAFIPHVSGSWATQLGVNIDEIEEESASQAD